MAFAWHLRKILTLGHFSLKAASMRGSYFATHSAFCVAVALLLSGGSSLMTLQTPMASFHTSWWTWSFLSHFFQYFFCKRIARQLRKLIVHIIITLRWKVIAWQLRTHQDTFFVAPPPVIEVAVPLGPCLARANLHDIGHVSLHSNRELIGQHEVLLPQDPHVFGVLRVVTAKKCLHVNCMVAAQLLSFIYKSNYLHEISMIFAQQVLTLSQAILGRRACPSTGTGRCPLRQS